MSHYLFNVLVNFGQQPISSRFSGNSVIQILMHLGRRFKAIDIHRKRGFDRTRKSEGRPNTYVGTTLATYIHMEGKLLFSMDDFNIQVNV